MPIFERQLYQLSAIIGDDYYMKEKYQQNDLLSHQQMFNQIVAGR